MAAPDAQAVAAAQANAREYLRAKGTLVPTPVLRARIADAFAALDALLGPLAAAEVTQAPIPGEWTVQEIVDHLVETHRPGLDELRCLLAARRGFSRRRRSSGHGRGSCASCGRSTATSSRPSMARPPTSRPRRAHRSSWS